LAIFGRNVEDQLGPVRFVAFYLVCGILSGVVHTVVNADSVERSKSARPTFCSTRQP
ncbi:MAG TPA: rhomboid family intramembrane serine protease, partial [Chloroflexi bacterium]|nr:rhomboid family intramembrane serine protease [Chloroflexota bacterium]